jgi:mRNA interferase YafQ
LARSKTCSPIYMRTIERTNTFKQDYKRKAKGKPHAYVRKLDEDLNGVLRMLATDCELDPRYRDHSLTGKWKHHRDCHIWRDLVLIYRKPDQDILTLVRLGSHSDLFRATK